MTGTPPVEGQSATVDLGAFVPVLRDDFERRVVAGESVVWSPLVDEPTVLDPVATVMLDVVDGTASIAELATDVHEVVGVPMETAQRQVLRVVEEFGQKGLLTSSSSETTADETIANRPLFVSDSTPCAETASNLGTVQLHLRFDDREYRITCDSRRGARVLREALREHVVDDEHVDASAPLAFLLTAPQGFKRTHQLTDRSGFVLSEGKGLDAGLHALGCHITAFLPPAEGTVRIRARAVVTGDDTTVLCLFPHLFFPVVADKDLAAAGVSLVDRFVLDLDPHTGAIVNPDVPWPALGGLETGRAHFGTGGRRNIDVVIDASAPVNPVPSSAASFVAQIAASGVHGSTGALLDAAVQIVERATLRSVPPSDGAVVDALRDLT
jgi:hypothetical protein